MDNRFRLLSAERLISDYRLQVRCGEGGRPISMSSCQVTREAAIEDIKTQLSRLGIELDLTLDLDGDKGVVNGWTASLSPPNGKSTGF